MDFIFNEHKHEIQRSKKYSDKIVAFINITRKFFMKSQMALIIVVIFSMLLFGCSQRNDLPENSPYIYAQSGVFLVRYSIAEDIVDKWFQNFEAKPLEV